VSHAKWQLDRRLDLQSERCRRRRLNLALRSDARLGADANGAAHLQRRECRTRERAERFVERGALGYRHRTKRSHRHRLRRGGVDDAQVLGVIGEQRI
jgi:hypothetical protein